MNRRNIFQFHDKFFSSSVFSDLQKSRIEFFPYIIDNIPFVYVSRIWEDRDIRENSHTQKISKWFSETFIHPIFDSYCCNSTNIQYLITKYVIPHARSKGIVFLQTLRCQKIMMLLEITRDEMSFDGIIWKLCIEISSTNISETVDSDSLSCEANLSFRMKYNPDIEYFVDILNEFSAWLPCWSQKTMTKIQLVHDIAYTVEILGIQANS